MTAPAAIAIAGDTHVNSTVALCHGDGCPLDDGGTYEPTRAGFLALPPRIQTKIKGIGRRARNGERLPANVA